MLSIGCLIGSIASLFGINVIIFNGVHVSGFKGFYLGITYSIVLLFAAFIYNKIKYYAK